MTVLLISQVFCTVSTEKDMFQFFGAFCLLLVSSVFCCVMVIMVYGMVMNWIIPSNSVVLRVKGISFQLKETGSICDRITRI